MGALIGREVTVVTAAYLLAGIPVVCVSLAGVMSPLYRMPPAWYLRQWSRLALAIVVCALIASAA